ERGPREEVGREEAAEVLDAEAAERGDGIRRERERGAGVAPDAEGEEAAEPDAEGEDEVPEPGRAPVVSEELGARPVRKDGGAGVAEVGREAEHLAAVEEEGRHEQPEERAGHVPGPGIVSEERHGWSVGSAP